jgi:uncharacterized protein (TIGR02996 family)
MSTDRAALIAGILEAPDDDAPRLVFADWLEEQGGEENTARAEFIRVQIARAKLPQEDGRHSALQARELRLLKRYAPAWHGSHFAFKKVRFRRGFIEYVHLHLQHFLHHRRQLLALEPVRDVRLTGWHRASEDLVRRVAACEEWRHIESLRIHHQGPHKHPRGELLLLLESPYLARLRVLHCPMVSFDEEDRRRYERLPLLRRLREFNLPTLNRHPHNPGAWFSGEGMASVNQWDALRSFRLPGYLDLELLERLSATPFWDRLTSLTLALPWATGEGLACLRDRMPEGLRELRLSPSHSPADYSSADSFFERLSQAPLQGLHLRSIPISTASLRRFLDGTSKCELRQLTLQGGITDEHVRVIAEAPGVKGLQLLQLSWNQNSDVEGVRPLFASEHLASLVELNLRTVALTTEDVRTFAGTPGWDRLRSLGLSGRGIESADLAALFASSNLQNLNWLNFGAPDISPDIARAIHRLPHLVCLRAAQCAVRSKEILSAGDALAWASLFDAENRGNIQAYRASLAPERQPPVDAALDWWEGR